MLPVRSVRVRGTHLSSMHRHYPTKKANTNTKVLILGFLSGILTSSFSVGVLVVSHIGVGRKEKRGSRY